MHYCFAIILTFHVDYFSGKYLLHSRQNSHERDNLVCNFLLTKLNFFKLHIYIYIFIYPFIQCLAYLLHIPRRKGSYAKTNQRHPFSLSLSLPLTSQGKPSPYCVPLPSSIVEARLLLQYTIWAIERTSSRAVPFH